MPWVYAYGETDFTDGYTTSGFQPSAFAYGGEITFSQAGTINQLSVWGETLGGAVDVKMALYDTSGNLIVDAGTVSMSNIDPAWVDSSTFTATNVSAATYVILYSGANNDDPAWGYDTANDGSFATEAHADFPSDPETITVGGDTGQGYGGRAFFTASSSTALPLLNAYYHG